MLNARRIQLRNPDKNARRIQLRNPHVAESVKDSDGFSLVSKWNFEFMLNARCIQLRKPHKNARRIQLRKPHKNARCIQLRNPHVAESAKDSDWSHAYFCQQHKAETTHPVTSAFHFFNHRSSVRQLMIHSVLLLTARFRSCSGPSDGFSSIPSLWEQSKPPQTFFLARCSSPAVHSDSHLAKPRCEYKKSGRPGNSSVFRLLSFNACEQSYPARI